jgi:hypothetical protein
VLVQRYIDNVVATDRNMIAKVFHVLKWTSAELDRTMWLLAMPRCLAMLIPLTGIAPAFWEMRSSAYMLDRWFRICPNVHLRFMAETRRREDLTPTKLYAITYTCKVRRVNHLCRSQETPFNSTL